MASDESNREEESVSARHSRKSSVFPSLCELFAECVSNVRTPLSAEQRNRLANTHDEQLASILPELDEHAFGSFPISYLHSVAIAS